MRSVVVVLPASMCAMMPMLRTLVRSVRTSSATRISSRSLRKFCGACRAACGPARGFRHAARPDERAAYRALSPAVVREGLVGLGHLVRVLATLHRGTKAVRRVEDLVHEE